MKKLINNPEYFEKLDACPWCGDNSTRHHLWCEDSEPFRTVQCLQCGMIYVQIRLNRVGRDQYYTSYYSKEHQLEKGLNEKRDKMYSIEAAFIKKHISQGRVLDVGCSGGNFLVYFRPEQWDRWGIEYGREAVKVAQQRIGLQIIHGELTEVDLPLATFDLIVFRGVIEHVPEPKRYLEFAIKLLAPGGKIFIGSTPNRNSLCADLFRERWDHHQPEAHMYHFSPRDFKQFFYQNSMKLIGETSFYLETPYANLENDWCLIKQAVECRSQGRKIDFKSPPFWGNLMTLMFERQAN